jgi:tetratricopeptide (TPR) repeat protein
VMVYLLSLRSQFLGLLAEVAIERGDLEMALDLANKAALHSEGLSPTNPSRSGQLSTCLRKRAEILEALGRLDEALALDAEWLALNPGKDYQEALVRLAMKHRDEGEDDEAEEILRRFEDQTRNVHVLFTSKKTERHSRPLILLAELLERRGTEEALAEARTLRDEVAQQLAEHEARRAAALNETRAAAAEAVRQWREERIKARGKGGKGRGKKKGKGKKKGRSSKGKDKVSLAVAMEGNPPHEPAGDVSEAAAAVEGASAAEAGQQAPVAGESQPATEEKEAREELDDDEDPWCDEGEEGERLVVLRCGHRFHEICGDMWCAKCADKGWGVTCPGCRAPYVVATE